MAIDYAGYAYLAGLDAVKALELGITCQVMPVQRKQVIGNLIAIPARLKPDDRLLSHVLFALKHEGTNLQILAQILPLIDAQELLQQFDASPTGKYVRIACFLWEHFTGSILQQSEPLNQGNYVSLFDPDEFITLEGYRDKRWRVIFNGLGSLNYCISVRRTERLEKALQLDLLQTLHTLSESLDASLLNRALSWAYLSETRDSFAIEKEVPDASKMQRYINLLRHAHDTRIIDEDYLVYLQNETINNPFDKAVAFRGEQNYLSNARGALGVTYVPPSPELCDELMQEWMALVNQVNQVNQVNRVNQVDHMNHMPKETSPLVLGAVLSFGFVFIHPFMDGNGRLSRFIFHHVLCQCGQLCNGLILPVSAVLHDNERDYLDALTNYSAKTRAFWEVEYIDVDNLTLSFQGHDSIYRYWDGTACAELMLEASETAIEQYIKREVAYLGRYDALKKYINQQFDVADKTLSNLTMHCLEQQGKLSRKRRDQYRYKVPEELFDAMEKAYTELFDD